MQSNIVTLVDSERDTLTAPFAAAAHHAVAERGVRGPPAACRSRFRKPPAETPMILATTPSARESA